MTVPAAAEQGTWTLRYVKPNDAVGNYTFLDTQALTTAGFPTTFEVVRTGA
ncbi:MAG: hypothetical protein ACRDYF_16410 [Acidimicrobiia bacterium]